MIQKSSGWALIIGALALTGYAIAFPIILPPLGGNVDFVSWVTHPLWRWLCLTAMIGLIVMMFGFIGLYIRIKSQSGLTGMAGFVALEVALLMMICILSWEVFQYPVIGEHTEAAFLLRDRIIWGDPAVSFFRVAASAMALLAMMLFGSGVLRSGQFGKLAPSLIGLGVVGTLLSFVSVLIELAGIVLLGLGVALLGVRLARGR